MEKRNKDLLNEDSKMSFLALLSMMIFGSAFWGIVLALRDIPPVTLGFLRAAMVSLFMFSLYIFMGRVLGRKKWTRPKIIFFANMKGVSGIILIIGTAFFGTALPNILQNIGMLLMDSGSTSSLASLIQGIGPVFTIFLAWIILKERMDRWKFTGLVIALPCTVVLTTYSSGDISLTSDETIGGTLNLLTAVSYSISGILLKTALNRKADPVALLGMNSTYAALMTFPLVSILWMIGVEEPIGSFSISLTSGLALFYISVCVYAVAAIIWYKVLKTGELSRITFFVFMLPVFSVILGYLLLGERLELVQIGAGVVLMVGVFLAQRSKKDNNVQPIRPPKV
jgi:drug/metabolite transporter (DMT)-like permease